MTKLNSNKLLANTKVDIERHCKEWHEFLEETECEGEADLTTQLRVRQDLLVKFFLWPRHPEQLNKVKFVLQATVVQRARAIRVGTTCCDGISGRRGHYCSQRLEIPIQYAKKGTQ